MGYIVHISRVVRSVTPTVLLPSTPPSIHPPCPPVVCESTRQREEGEQWETRSRAQVLKRQVTFPILSTNQVQTPARGQGQGTTNKSVVLKLGGRRHLPSVFPHAPHHPHGNHRQDISDHRRPGVAETLRTAASRANRLGEPASASVCRWRRTAGDTRPSSCWQQQKEQHVSWACRTGW